MVFLDFLTRLNELTTRDLVCWKDMFLMAVLSLGTTLKLSIPDDGNETGGGAGGTGGDERCGRRNRLGDMIHPIQLLAPLFVWWFLSLSGSISFRRVITGCESCSNKVEGLYL